MKEHILIVFLGNFFFDSRCINMANNILESNLKLSIIHTGNTKINKFQNASIYHLSLPKYGILKYLIFSYKIKKALNFIQPTKIIASDLYSLPGSCSYKNANIIYDSREIYTSLAALKNKFFSQLFWSFIEKLYIKKTQSVLVTAQTDGEILKKMYKNINIFNLYNFPSIKMKPIKTNSLKKKLGLTENNKIFLYQGALHHGRGIKIMLDLLKYFPNSNAVILGDGPYYNNLNEFVKKYDLKNRTHFLGKIPYAKLLQYTVEADLGFSLIRPITTSYLYALPNKVFEYALSNVPVIATDLPEMKKVINRYKLGITVPWDDKKKQIKAIKLLLNNHQNRNIYKTAEQHFTWEGQKNKLINSLNIKNEN